MKPDGIRTVRLLMASAVMAAALGKCRTQGLDHPGVSSSATENLGIQFSLESDLPGLITDTNVPAAAARFYRLVTPSRR